MVCQISETDWDLQGNGRINGVLYLDIHASQKRVQRPLDCAAVPEPHCPSRPHGVLCQTPEAPPLRDWGRTSPLVPEGREYDDSLTGQPYKWLKLGVDEGEERSS